MARQRKEELQRLNEQLRKINLSLRQQARAGTVYAPGNQSFWSFSLSTILTHSCLLCVHIRVPVYVRV